MPGPWTRPLKAAAAAFAQAAPWLPAALAAWALGSGDTWLAGGLCLLTRPRPDPALAHVRRRLILDAVVHSPGIGLRDLQQATQMPMGTLRHHVRVLLERGIVVERRQGRVRRFFQNQRRLSEAWLALVALRDPWLRQLHEALRAAPRRRRVLAADAEREWGWSRSTTYHRLTRLERVGLVATHDGMLQARDIPWPQGRKGRAGRGRPKMAWRRLRRG